MSRRALSVISLCGMFLFALILVVGLNNVRHAVRLTRLPAWLLIIIFILVVDFVQFMGRKALAGASHSKLPTLRVTSLSEFPQLDRSAFDYYDNQLSQLGFERRFCYTSDMPASPQLRGIAVVYYHPTYGCTAENAQSFVGNKRITWITLMTRFDDNWSFSTHNLKPNPVSCMMRKPRSLWKAMPKATPRMLFDAHLESCRLIHEGLGVGYRTPNTESEYFDAVLKNLADGQERFRRKNPLSARWEYWLYGMKPIYNWMGDLKKELRKSPLASTPIFR